MFLYIMGYSLNLLTMFALILVIGSLVDDAIVVVENVIRLMDEEKLSPREASIKSMQQITGAVIATTLVILAMYVPIGFYGGMVGKIYLQFSVTMCIALVLSTVNALTLSPALCAILLKPRKETRWNIFAPFDFVLEWSKKIYLFFTGILVRSALLTIILFAGVCVGTYYLFNNTLSSFIPEEDKGVLFCTVELDPGAALSRTMDVVSEVTERISPLPGVKEVLAVSGYSMLGGKGENLGFAVVALDDWDFRTTPETSISNILQTVQGLTYTLPEASIRVIQPPAIMGLGTTGGVTFMFQAKSGQTPEELEASVFALLQRLNALPETMMAFTTYNASTPQIFLDIDREKAKAMQVPVSRIFSTLQSQLAASYINDFNLDGYAFQVKIQANAEDRESLDSLMEINVRSDNGSMVPLSSFATFSYTRGARIITRFNQSMSASVTVMAKPGVSSGYMMNKIQEI